MASRKQLAAPRVGQPPPSIPPADQLSRREIRKFLPVLTRLVREQTAHLRLVVAASPAAVSHQRQQAVVVPRDLSDEQLEASHFDRLCDLSPPTRAFAWWQPASPEEARQIDLRMCRTRAKLFVLVRWASRVQAAADRLTAR